MAMEGRNYLREKVRVRDGHKCQKCGKQWSPGQRRLDVHHLDEEIEGVVGMKYANNPIDRMVTLCHRCHLNLPHIRAKFDRTSTRLMTTSGFTKTSRDAHIMARREAGLTLQQIGDELGITRERVRQIMVRVSGRVKDY
jgi:hypothetical protein